MGETRAGKYGKNLALLIDFIVGSSDNCEDYKRRFVFEMKKYSFEGRKRGEGRNLGCVYELAGLGSVDINNPEQLARLVKEGLHLMYQKNSAKRVFDALLAGLEGKI